MLALDILLYIWLSLICCMCSRLCYEVYIQKHPTSCMRISYMKRKLFSVFNKDEPLIHSTEMTDSIVDADVHYTADDPPEWVRESA